MKEACAVEVAFWKQVWKCFHTFCLTADSANLSPKNANLYTFKTLEIEFSNIKKTSRVSVGVELVKNVTLCISIVTESHGDEDILDKSHQKFYNWEIKIKSDCFV